MIFGNLYAIHPLLPLIAEHYQVSTLQASNAFTLTSLTLGLSLLVLGPLSDAFGRRAPLVIGMAVTAVWFLAANLRFACRLRRSRRRSRPDCRCCSGYHRPGGRYDHRYVHG